MKKQILLVLLVIYCISARLNCRAANTFNQTIITNIPSAIDISTISTKNIGEINPETGLNSGVNARFLIKSNGGDKNYNYILQANVLTKDLGDLNAYGSSNSKPFIILGNIDANNYPKSDAINNILQSPQKGNNPNAIAYPISTNSTEFKNITFLNNPKFKGYNFKILMNSNQKGYVNQQVENSPIINTYYYGEDKPGVYQAILTLSAFRKP